MNRFALILLAVFFCMSCDKEPDDVEIVGIEDISFENYPKVDGSTSASVLNDMIACKLLGLSYKWEMGSSEWFIASGDIPANWDRIKISQTHGAFMNLIDGNADIILTHRTISPDEKKHADAVGVTLIETPIALDAFVFVVNPKNSVKSLTVKQIQNIYTGKITNWLQVGGGTSNINVYARPRNSGSEEVFRELVMNGLEPLDFPDVFIIQLMHGVLVKVLEDADGICYTFNNYAQVIARMPDIPKIAINGIYPSKNTIKSKVYPFISEVHVAIRSDLDHHSMAYKLYEWLQSNDAKSVIEECGFIAKKK